MRTTGLSHDVGLAGVLLGVQHLMGEVFLDQQLVDDFRVFYRRGAHQHGLATLVTFPDVLDRSLVFFPRSFINTVQLVVASADAVRRDDGGLQAVDFLKLKRLRVGGPRHAGQLVVQPKVVLERDGSQCLVFGLDLYTFLGLHSLVQAIAPAAARHQATGEFVHDHHFRARIALLHYIVLVTVIQ